MTNTRPSSTLPPIATPAYMPYGGAGHGPSPRKIKKSRFRRSRKVLVFKIALPLVAAGLVGLVLAWPQLQSDDDQWALERSTTITSDTANSRPQVLNPRLSGVDQDGQPFEITADIGTAAVGENGEEIYYLTQPRASLSLNGGAWVALDAADGIYEPVSEILELKDGVSLFHDSGVEFQTESARILMGERTAEGDLPIHGFGDFGEITSAGGFRILDDGDRVIFLGKTNLLLNIKGSALFAGGSAETAR